MNLLPNKIPKKVYSLIGEFIVQFNVMDFKFKHFLSSFIEDELIGYLIASNQSFDFTKKRVNSIYAQLIVDKELKERWETLQTEISELANIRNDFAHSIIDFDNVSKSQFLMTRYSENKVLKFSSRQVLYSIDDVKSFISRMKKTNRKISYLFHTTFRKYNDVVYYNGTGTMF
jgi:hypothetical protein